MKHLAGLGRVSRRTIIRETSGGIGVQRAQLGRSLDGLASDFREQIGAAPNGMPRFASYGGLRVGDTVELTFRGAPGIPPRRARIRELFPGPAGPTADIEVEDLVRGKVKRVLMWTAVGNLVPSGAPPHVVARTASKMRQGVGESELQYITLRHGRDSHHLANEASHCLR
ncbi:hypothetical protein [Cupriavidus sp. USMAHM13]|uniref:hypothetical protein n=1 Tax=Cupriavidus sp. USMAHM13 TaxID=1389192 RepID=UPI0012EAE987|nr:hypothetical protein [Cupriavidus sp. USMAHM13]